MEEKLSDNKKKKLLDKIVLADLGITPEELKSLKKKLLKAKGKPDRGVETWFRLASKNLYTRLQIADTKSNILITINAIIISVILGSFFNKMDEDPHLIFAVGGIIITNILSITFAILATIPPPPRGSRNKNMEELDLMSFDDFHDTDIEDYHKAVLNTIDAGDTLYPSMITDIHRIGVLLAKKYKLIRIAYQVFLYGLILSILAFGACHTFFHSFME